jgi:hypothetical protein
MRFGQNQYQINPSAPIYPQQNQQLQFQQPQQQQQPLYYSPNLVQSPNRNLNNYDQSQMNYNLLNNNYNNNNQNSGRFNGQQNFQSNSQDLELTEKLIEKLVNDLDSENDRFLREKKNRQQMHQNYNNIQDNEDDRAPILSHGRKTYVNLEQNAKKSSDNSLGVCSGSRRVSVELNNIIDSKNSTKNGAVYLGLEVIHDIHGLTELEKSCSQKCCDTNECDSSLLSLTKSPDVRDIFFIYFGNLIQSLKAILVNVSKMFVLKLIY